MDLDIIHCFINMEKIKITINSENRIVIIPLEYDNSNDSIEIKEIQVEPIPQENEDISKDIVLLLTQNIMSMFKTMLNK